ncbi:lipid A deacylase LpxR family protein [Parvularcula maris]|uniref:Lipid A deacylase LpxR family protein n=1 Tax=Parvularcula maris TaxID=2965077 RepID=A0A9X2RKD2_9PROT|nr:lipid A deacylase LpxR family protein [Parvularcula maris]MCQ8185658.1 lipid A deacylase LpxR family protein [Parvularcula maris]
MFKRAILTAAAPLALLAAQSEARDLGTLTVTAENDFVANQDRHYTNGLRAAYVTGEVRGTSLERRLGGYGATLRRSFAVAQQIYTPKDYFTDTPDPDDHPYAGYLFAEAGLLAEKNGRFDLFTLELGVVGPAALGEETQNWFHERRNYMLAEGWDHQLPNEVAVNLSYDWKGRPWAEGRMGPLEAEFTPVAGASLGNVAVNARAGGMVRLGSNLRPNFGPARIRPSLTGSGHFSRGVSWFLFAGAEARAVAHDIFLDGSLVQDSASTDKNPLVGDLQAGAVMELGRVQLSWTYVARTERYEAQDDPDGYGGFSVGVKF